MSEFEYRPNNSMKSGPRRFAQVPEDSPSFYSDLSCNYFLSRPSNVGAQNLVSNPSGEEPLFPTEGWLPATPFLTLVSTTDEQFSGVRAFQATPGPGGGSFQVSYSPGASIFGPMLYPFAEVANRTPMNACCWVKGPPGDRISLDVREDNAAGVHPGTTILNASGEGFVIANGEWQLLCGAWRPVGTTGLPLTVDPQLSIFITSDNRSSNQSPLYFDLVTATLGLSVIPFDGDSGPGYSWVGAPHLSNSVASRFARQHGSPVAFQDLGFDIYSHAGFGMAPVENLVTSYASQGVGNVGHYQRTVYRPRVITLQGTINSCHDPYETHAKRAALINSMVYKFESICSDEALLWYGVRSPCCGLLTTQLVIPVVYQGGLEGNISNPWQERVTLQFVSNQQVLWSTLNQTGVTLTGGNVIQNINYGGNADSAPILRIRGFIAASAPGNLINTTTGQQIIWLPTASVPAGSWLLLDLDPNNFRALIQPGDIDIRNQIDYTQSDVANWRMTPGFNLVQYSGGGAQFASLAWFERYKSADSIIATGRCSRCGNN